MSDFRLGVNNCFAVKRWPEPREWVGKAKRMGVDMVQLSFDTFDPTLPDEQKHVAIQEIKDALAENGVELHSVFTGVIGYSQNYLLHPNLAYRVRALRWFEQAIEAASALGAKSIGGHFGTYSVSDFGDDQRREQLKGWLVEGLQHLSSVAEHYGIESLLWEPMPIKREIPHNIAEAVDLYHRVNERASVPVRYCFDVGHACAYDNSERDKDPYVWLQEVGPLCDVIHLQQTDGAGDRHWPFTEEFNEKGIIDPQKVLNTLRDANVTDVALIFEPIHAFEAEENRVLQDFEASVNYWRQHLSGDQG